MLPISVCPFIVQFNLSTGGSYDNLIVAAVGHPANVVVCHFIVIVDNK